VFGQPAHTAADRTNAVKAVRAPSVSGVGSGGGGGGAGEECCKQSNGTAMTTVSHSRSSGITTSLSATGRCKWKRRRCQHGSAPMPQRTAASSRTDALLDAAAVTRTTSTRNTHRAS
jgi:hypothetical protein